MSSNDEEHLGGRAAIATTALKDLATAGDKDGPVWSQTSDDLNSARLGISTSATNSPACCKLRRSIAGEQEIEESQT